MEFCTPDGWHAGVGPGQRSDDATSWLSFGMLRNNTSRRHWAFMATTSLPSRRSMITPPYPLFKAQKFDVRLSTSFLSWPASPLLRSTLTPSSCSLLQTSKGGVGHRRDSKWIIISHNYGLGSGGYIGMSQ